MNYASNWRSQLNTLQRFATFSLTCLFFIAGDTAAKADLLGPGDIAFVGLNADGQDDLAIVLLADAPVGTTVFFTDDEWDAGTATFGGSEGILQWVVTEPIPAGTVVTFDDVIIPGNASHGTVTEPDNGFSISGSGEAVTAYIGSQGVPTAFLAQIFTDSIGDSSTGDLGTGISEAAGTVVILPTNSSGGQYVGMRSGQSSFEDYLTLIGNEGANWDSDLDDGQQYVPFDSTPFTIGVTLDGINVSIGSADSGGLPELGESDDQYVVLDPEFLTFRYQLEFTVDATSHSETPSALEFGYESRAINFVGTVDQQIELFNYVSGQFETIDTRLTSSTDTVVSVTPGGDPARFVQSGTRAMQARISYQNSLQFWVFNTQNLYLPYSVRADHVFWTITP